MSRSLSLPDISKSRHQAGANRVSALKLLVLISVGILFVFPLLLVSVNFCCLRLQKELRYYSPSSLELRRMRVHTVRCETDRSRHAFI